MPPRGPSASARTRSSHAARPDPYAPPSPGYTAPGYGYQAPANPPTSPYLQPGEPGYGAQPVAAPTRLRPARLRAGAVRLTHPVAPKTLSIVSMVLGLVGHLPLDRSFSLGAVITGHIGAKREPHAKGVLAHRHHLRLRGCSRFWVVIIVFWVRADRGLPSDVALSTRSARMARRLPRHPRQQQGGRAVPLRVQRRAELRRGRCRPRAS